MILISYKHSINDNSVKKFWIRVIILTWNKFQLYPNVRIFSIMFRWSSYKIMYLYNPTVCIFYIIGALFFIWYFLDKINYL